MLSTVVYFCYAAVFYTYFGYPLLLLCLNMLGPKRRYSLTTFPKHPKITVIIAVRDANNSMTQKLENILEVRKWAESFAEEIQVIVASDGCKDGTEEIVCTYQGHGIELIRSDEHRGKEFVQGLALTHARGDIIVFTDVRTILSVDAFEKLIPYFRDPTVGAVSSIDQVIPDAQGESGEGMYVRYEMWLRRLESEFDSVVSLSGSCFAVRRQLCEPWRSDIPSDFSLLLAAQQAGFRGVQACDVTCFYRAVGIEAEFQRKVRTVLRGITSLFQRQEVLHPLRYRFFSLQVFSHKLCRWLVPWWLLVAGSGTLILASDSLFFQVLAFLEIVFVGLAILGNTSQYLRRSLLFRIPLFFLLSNVAIAVAWTQYWSGKRIITWIPSKSGGG